MNTPPPGRVPSAVILSLTIALGFTTWRLHVTRQVLTEARLQLSQPFPGLLLPLTTLRTLAGDSILVGKSSASGKRQVILMWTSKCKYCQESASLWKELAQVSRDSALGVEVVGISPDSASAVERFVSAHSLDIKAAAVDARLLLLYRAMRLPAVVVANSRGVATYAHVGLADRAAMDSLIQYLQTPRRVDSETIRTVDSR